MVFPRISARHYFWILTLAVLAWAIVTPRLAGSDTADTRGGFGPRVESPFRTATSFALALPSALLEKVQGAWARLLLRPGKIEAEAVDYQQLLDENARLKREAAIRITELERDQDLLLQYKLIRERFTSLSPQNMLPANIIGHTASVASNYCTLDKGSASGVRMRCPVLLQLALLGRVTETVGPYTCSVQLLTDRGMKPVEARVVRMTPQGSMTIVNSCMVHGNGNGSLRCDTIRVQALPPQKDDLLLLKDNEWPAAVQGAVIGQVQDVRSNEAQPLRYDLRIEPAVTVHAPGQVSIVLIDR